MKAPRWIALSLCVASLAISALAVFALPTAEAQRRGGGIRASIYLTQAAVPRGLTEKALIGFARGHQARTMEETQEADLAQRRWLGNMVIQFSQPIDDLEYHALFYDLTDGVRNFVDDLAINISDRAQRTFVQRVTLARPRFRPNRRMELVITVRRAEVGSLRFDTRGEEPRRTGQVDFTVEDTQRRD